MCTICACLCASMVGGSCEWDGVSVCDDVSVCVVGACVWDGVCGGCMCVGWCVCGMV